MDSKSPSSAEWYNIYNLKGTGGKLYTVVENSTGNIMNNPSEYRIVLLKFRKQHADGRRWSMPMWHYELYKKGGCMELPPNDIAESNAWWEIQRYHTPWFATTGALLKNVISLGERYNTENGTTSNYSWKNTRNKKMKIGVAVYKYTGEGKIGWHRCSNIAFVELYKQNGIGKYEINMMP